MSEFEENNRLVARNFFDVFLDKSGKLFDALSDLYKSEINFSILCFYDAGFNVRLGDEINGYLAEDNFDTLYDAIQWLLNMAITYFPKSVFAQDYGVKRR